MHISPPTSDSLDHTPRLIDFDLLLLKKAAINTIDIIIINTSLPKLLPEILNNIISISRRLQGYQNYQPHGRFHHLSPPTYCLFVIDMDILLGLFDSIDI
jgi:hypothetical protein